MSNKSVMAAISLILSVSSLSNAQILINLNAEGRSGQNGSHANGYSTSPGSSSGEGRNGDHASASTPGGKAGAIDVTLEDILSTDQLKSMINGNSSQSVKIGVIGTVNGSNTNITVDYSKNNYLLFNARGGRGGNGGWGGDGQGGCNGRNGRDADKSSKGSNGTDGCRGGNGGDGTTGSMGGQGGIVTIRLNENDMHLAMLFKIDIEGGDGGDPGKNGQPGQGGNKGRGGDSHSWTTRRQIGESCSGGDQVCSGGGLVSNGDGSYSSTSQTCTTTPVHCTPTYTYDSHYNSGGSDGHDGPSGSPGRGNIQRGAKGPSGKYEVLVSYQNGSIERYAKVFSLSLISYDLIDENNNGIFEPGEKVSVSNMIVKNTGGMPTPYGKAKALVFLQNTDWFAANPIQIEIPRLQAGQSYQVNQAIEFKIKDTNVIGQNERLVIKDSITPISKLTRIDQVFGDFKLPKTISITYPIEITPIVAQKMVGSGETITVSWKVKNISKKSFGGNSELMRKIVTTLMQSENHSLNSNAQKLEKVRFIKNSEETSLTQKFTEEILELKPGQEMLISGQLKFSDALAPYTTVDIQNGLEISKSQTSSDTNTIQLNKYTFKVSQFYKNNPNSDLLLVTNSATEREEFVSWMKVMDQLGLIVDVWDVNFNGFFALTKMIKDSNSTLMENYRNKTVVILNYKSNDIHKRSADLIAKAEFISSLKNAGINFLLLGGDIKDSQALVRNLILPNKPQRFENSLPNISDVEAIKEEGVYIVDGKVKKWGENENDAILRMAEKLIKQTQKSQPNEGYMVSPIRKSNGADKLGYIEIKKSLSPYDGVVSSLNIEDSELHKSVYIEGEENIRALLLSMGTKTKLKVLSQLNKTQPSSDIIKMVSDSIIHDIVSDIDLEEVTATINTDNKMNMALDLLMSEIKSNKYKNLSQNDPTAISLVKILAATQFYIETLKGGLIFGRNNFMKTKLEELNKVIDSAKSIFAFDYKREIKTEIKVLDSQLDKRKDKLVDLDLRENIRRQLILPAINRLNSSEHVTRARSYSRSRK
ncbi:MAG: hypothetical protein H6625_09505 [Bdellovibrionaceae bacterium]|nr:hypothetical protein [Pseudobdellovibrionaceae bacterium]